MGVSDTFYPLVIACLVVDGVAVALRLWARSIRKAVGYDDVAMIFSLISFIVFCAMELQAIRYGIGATMMEASFDPAKAAMFSKTAQVVYILTTGISKLGVGLVLFRLASGVGRLTALIFGLQCRPLSVAWGVRKGSCPSTAFLGTTGLALSDMNLLPIYMLYKTQLRLRLEIMIMVLLGLDAVSSIAIVVRLKYLVELSRLASASGGLASRESVETTLEATVYSILEIGLSILAASLTALRPLLKRVPCLGDVASDGPPKPNGFGSLNTFGKGSNNKGPAYRLEDRNVSDAGSQESIIPARPAEIIKQTDVELIYSPANMERARVQDGDSR